jgi:hypothetical protein
MELPYELYVLVITHNNGTDAWICEDEETALESADLFVQAWWDNEQSSWDADTQIPMPDDRTERIKQYFDDVAPHESYTIRPSRVRRRGETLL